MTQVLNGYNIPEPNSRVTFVAGLADLISAAGADVTENGRRERLRHFESADKAHPLELAKVQLGASRSDFFEMDIKQ